jgi:hypothetical protein
MSSSNFFSVTEERTHALAGRTGLFLAMDAGIVGQRWRGLEDGGYGESMTVAKERESSCKRLGRSERSLGLRIYTSA